MHVKIYFELHDFKISIDIKRRPTYINTLWL